MPVHKHYDSCRAPSLLFSPLTPEKHFLIIKYDFDRFICVTIMYVVSAPFHPLLPLSRI